VSQTRPTIRIVLADEQSLFRQAMGRALDEEPDLEVVGEARDGWQAVDAAESLRPDVVVIASDLRGCESVRATELIMSRIPQCHVLFLGSRDDPELLLDAIEAGATGFVAKSQPLEDLVRATRVVLGGGTLLPTRLLAPLITTLKGRIHDHDTALRRLSRLSERELEVLGLLTDGADNESIAARLVISPETARTHVQHVLAKLEVHSRLEAAAFVAQNGIRDHCWSDPVVVPDVPAAGALDGAGGAGRSRPGALSTTGSGGSQ
jgi:DNA-binding NarL/FixJ family response regulator